MTIEEFEKLPDELAINHEFVDGKLIDLGGNIGDHHRLRDIIVALTCFHVEREKLGIMISEQDFDFNGDVLGPDVSFIGIDKLHLCRGNLRVQPFVPDMAIEIASEPGMLEAALKKAQRYRECGVKEVWIFSIEMRAAYLFSDRQRTILGADSEFRSDLVPGFSIRIGDLLDRL
jgi:Uma2 family endonuclease